MKILCVGDVVGAAGCGHLRQVLPGVKRHYGVDVCIVNGENAAEGNGLLPPAAAHIFDSGADVITPIFRLPPPAGECVRWIGAGIS